MTPEQTATPVVSSAGRVSAPRDLPSVAAPDDFSFTAAGPAAPPTALVGDVGRRVPVAALWLAASLATAVLTAFLGLVVSGRVVTEGPVVMALTRTHGIHTGDLWALAAWCLAVGTVIGAALAATVAARRP